MPTLDDENDDAEDTSDIKVGVTSTGERYVDLGKKKRATVNQFKGASYSLYSLYGLNVFGRQ